MSEINWSTAPEGATHYNSFNHMFYKVEGEKVYCESNSGWCISAHNAYDFVQYYAVIPRPTNQEQGDGLPRMAIMVNPHEAPLYYGDDHLGKEIEVIEHLPDESCYVVRFDWGLGVLHDSMIDFGLYDLKTQQDSLREELINLHIEHEGSTIREIADAVIKFYEERYNLEPKQ